MKQRLFKIFTIGLASVMALGVMSGCGSQNQASENAENTQNASVENDSADISVTEIRVQHAYGETVLKQKPERVVTIAWENGDTPLALGIAPVGISESNYGAETKNHLHAWTDEAFAERGVETPNVFDDTAGWDYEAIADAKPDVILCAYSGISQEEYDMLSQIAPTVPYKQTAWQTTWRDQTIENAAALGMEEEGKALVAKTEELIADKLQEYPDIAGKKTAFCWIDASDMSTFYIYLNTDPRAAYLEDLGLAVPDSVRALAENTEDFSVTVSRENADKLDDIEMIIAYGDESLLDAMQADELMNRIPAVRDGAVVLLDSASNLAAGTTPSVLSIPYNIDEYLKLIDEAAKKVQ